MNLERYISITDFAEQEVYACIQTFANIYASSGFTKEVKVFKSKKNPYEFLINFSEDIDFERFMYLVSCMPHSEDLEPFDNFSYGYWTISKEDDIHKELHGKRVQLYMSKHEKHRDNVYAIAQGDTESIKLGFAHGEEYIPLGKKEFVFFEKKQNPSDFYPPHIIYGIEKEEPISKKNGCSLFLLFLLIVTSTVLFSCNSNVSDSNSLFTYGSLNNRFNYSILTIQKQIEEIVSDEILSNNINAKIYHDATNDYVSFLNSIEDSFTKNVDFSSNERMEKDFANPKYVNNVLFEGNNYSSIGNNFIKKSKEYQNIILELIEDEYLLEKMNMTLNTDSVRNRKGEKLYYLNYLYKDKPLIAVLAMIRLHKHTILQYEYEHLLVLKNQLQSKET
ncbi:hypothetical protein [uncultured Dokdonia sp.]|uniref:hypothetical protein n=1 Tax=uncultured Dokdonia sp. TaxID=575653 RepID=UPI00260865AA|nr:hypothetical protein [uncultured Dokdonia sp.]